MMLIIIHHPDTFAEILFDESKPSGDDAPYRFSRFGVLGKGRLVHALPKFKALGFNALVCWIGLVDVSRHRISITLDAMHEASETAFIHKKGETEKSYYIAAEVRGIPFQTQHADYQSSAVSILYRLLPPCFTRKLRIRSWLQLVFFLFQFFYFHGK